MRGVKQTRVSSEGRSKDFCFQIHAMGITLETSKNFGLSYHFSEQSGVFDGGLHNAAQVGHF
jgi:hypothetical protein